MCLKVAVHNLRHSKYLSEGKLYHVLKLAPGVALAAAGQSQQHG